MAGNRKQRLGKVETALTPQQAVRQWLQEAHQHHSLTAYAAYLKTQPWRSTRCPGSPSR